MAAAAHLRRLRETLDGPVTFGELAARMGRDGIGLLAITLSVPFLQPIPLAGLSTPVGLVLAAAGLQLARGAEEPALPRFVAGRRLERATVERVLGFAERVLLAVERLARRRWRALLAPRVYGAALAVVALVFAVPMFVPLGSQSSAVAMILLGLALLEEDGLLGALGLAASAAAVAIHLAFAVLVWTGGRALLRRGW